MSRAQALVDLSALIDSEPLVIDRSYVLDLRGACEAFLEEDRREESRLRSLAGSPGPHGSEVF